MEGYSDMSLDCDYGVLPSALGVEPRGLLAACSFLLGTGHAFSAIVKNHDCLAALVPYYVAWLCLNYYYYYYYYYYH